MDDLKYFLELIFKDEIEKVIISNPRLKSEAVRKLRWKQKRMDGRLPDIPKSRCFMKTSKRIWWFRKHLS